MNAVSLDALAFIADKPEGPETIAGLLLSPETVLWEETGPERFFRTLGRILENLGRTPSIADFLKIHLAVQVLLRPEKAPEWCIPGLQDLIDPCDLLPVPVSAAAAFPWRAVPVALAGPRGEIRVVHLVAGCLPETPSGVGWPRWADALLGKEAKEALTAAGSTGPRPAAFWVFPLTVPNGRIQIRGRSLGLPAALAFRSALLNAPLSRDIVATGVVRADGSVRAVSFLGEKAAGLPKNVRALVHPYENGAVRKPSIDAYPVRTVDQAWMISQLHRPGDPERLHLFSAMMEDPALFVSNIHAVPDEWLRWSLENGRLSSLVRDIRSAPPLFAALADQLEASVRSGRNDSTETLSLMIDPVRDFPELADGAPLTAFRWAGLNLCVSNHRGKPETSGFWSGEGRKLLDPAFRADIHLVSDFFNYEFVSRHNRYEFHPDPPRGLQRLLDVLERQYEIQCGFGCPTHPVLGRIYGTMAQNFGFCGPACLDRTIAFGGKARKALGEEAVPEYREEWLRHYNYLAYALLDAGDEAGARTALFRYLEIRNWEELLDPAPRFTAWRHALAARYFADTGDPAGTVYYTGCMEACEPTPPAHPWQLWRFNMGRIARTLGRKAEAEDWFRRSLDLCLSESFGPTVTVMALLPLSALADRGALTGSEIRRHESIIRRAARALDPAHFEGLLRTNFTETLAETGTAPQRLFPFNYR